MKTIAKKTVSDLVERICETRILTLNQGVLLRHLAKNTSPLGAHGRSGESRVAISRLRDGLRYYFDKTEDGRRESLRLSIGDAQALIAGLNQTQLTYVEHFWDAHCVGRDDSKLSVIHTEPIFFWVEKQRMFVRFLDVNWESTSEVPPELLGKTAGFNPSDLVPSFHYQPSGEIGAQRQLLAWLRNYDVLKRHSISVDSKLSRDFSSSDRDLWNANLIVLGNRRTNWIFRRLQEENRARLRWTIEAASIASANDGELQDGRNRAYALVTRMLNRDPRGVVTTIGANHGRAAEKVAEFLTNDKALASLYEKHDISAHQSLPRLFQILFAVDILDFDSPVGIEVIASTLDRHTDASPKATAPGTRAE